MLFFILISNLLIFDSTSGGQCEGNGSGEPSTIVMTQALIRHGQRAPTAPYPTDPLTNVTKLWKHGFGQLTDFGMEQNYQQGKYFLSRYSTLINPCFDVRDILVQSTDLDRVIISALQISAGMYPVKHSCPCIDGNYEIVKLNWQAVPNHVLTGTGANRLMLGNTAYQKDPTVCPKYMQLFNNLASDPILSKTYNDNKEFIEHFYTQTGITSQFTANAWWQNMFNVGADINYEYLAGYELPAWAATMMSNQTQVDFLAGLLRFGAITQEMQRLVGGPIINNWIQTIKNFIAGTETRKFFLLSAHGHNFVNVLSAFGLYDPPYATNDASAILVELHHINSQYEVKLFYREGLTATVNQLHLPNCNEPYTVDSLQICLQNVLPLNLTAECQV